MLSTLLAASLTPSASRKLLQAGLSIAVMGAAATAIAGYLRARRPSANAWKLVLVGGLLLGAGLGLALIVARFGVSPFHVRSAHHK